jgi:predicted metal-dependent HD superfamily phosphohydrolase
VGQQPAALQPTRWSGLWSRLGARSDGLQIYQQLLTAYSEPIRTYHNINHLQHCLIQLDANRGVARRPDEVEAALWFHDAVYVPGRADNEQLSGELARTALERGGAGQSVTQRVVSMVLATRHETVVEDRDAQLVCDIDLSILGGSPAEFQEFERQIRQEYSWVPAALYANSRSEVLRGFLSRPSIYQTDAYRSRHEERARQNLERLLAALAG